MEYRTFKLKGSMQQWNPAECSDSGIRGGDRSRPIGKCWIFQFLAVVKIVFFSAFAVCHYVTEVHTF